MPRQLLHFLVPAIVLGSLLSGCHARHHPDPVPPEQDFVGHYTSAPDRSWFQPCLAGATDLPQWVVFTGQSVAQVEKARAEGMFQPGERYFIKLRAIVTTGGEMSPGGKGKPALLVHELLEIHPTSPNDCEADAAKD